MNGRSSQRLPLWSLGLCGAALLVWALGAPLEYDRGALAAGDWWRAVTGHWTHWSFDHLLWDAATFAALGMLAELRSRRRFLLCTAGSAVAISAGLWVLRPDLASYRGLSGIDSALFALVAAGLLRDATTARRRVTSLVFGAALGGFALKLAWELSTGTALFVNDSGFECLPLAHALGATVGLPVGLWRDVRRQGGTAKRGDPCSPADPPSMFSCPSCSRRCSSRSRSSPWRQRRCGCRARSTVACAGGASRPAGASGAATTSAPPPTVVPNAAP